MEASDMASASILLRDEAMNEEIKWCEKTEAQLHTAHWLGGW
jgi:hypothetical protein